MFKLKLGDEVVHTVDVVAEVGYGKILHKWIEFDIREDVVYLNGTLVLVCLVSQPSMPTTTRTIKYALLSRELSVIPKFRHSCWSEATTPNVHLC